MCLPPYAGPADPTQSPVAGIPGPTLRRGFNCPLFPGYMFVAASNFIGLGSSVAPTLYQAYLSCSSQPVCTAFNTVRQLSMTSPAAVGTSSPGSSEPNIPGCAGLYVKISECASCQSSPRVLSGPGVYRTSLDQQPGARVNARHAAWRWLSPLALTNFWEI